MKHGKPTEIVFDKIRPRRKPEIQDGRQNGNYWGGMFSDQVIDQSLMRVIKASGGLARGRGITPNTEAKFIHVLPKCVPVCNALEEFSGVHIVDHLIIILIYTQVPHYAIFTTIRNTLIG